MREKTSQTTSPRIATATRTSVEPVQLQQLIKGADYDFAVQFANYR